MNTKSCKSKNKIASKVLGYIVRSHLEEIINIKSALILHLHYHGFLTKVLLYTQYN